MIDFRHELGGGGGSGGGCDQYTFGTEEMKTLDLGRGVENGEGGFTTLREAFYEAFKKVKERFLQAGIKIDEQKTEGSPE